MGDIRIAWMLLVTLMSTVNAVNDNPPILPACQASDFHFVYTECDSDGGRWRVAVPEQPGKCVGGAPPPPLRGNECSFTCEAGEYINIQSDQECHPCPAGTYSLGGGVRFEDWDHLPSGFSVETEEFNAESYTRSLWGHRESLNADRNCSSAGWTPKGKYIASIASECATSLVFSANLVKAGFVKFTYQYTDNTFFQFLVQNDQCQTVGDKNTKYPQQTQEGEWNTVKVNLKSGLNLLHWRTLGMAYGTTHYRHPVLIKSIEVSGVAFTSECTKCMNGTFSEEGASYCTECDPNTFSHRGAAQCTQCDPDSSYSDAGAAFCLPKKPCTEDNYFELSSGCDTNNETQRHYEWINPKICSEEMEGAVHLPPPSEKEPCPPCNPGMAYVNGACEFCTDNQYATGDGPCQECPASTAPEYGLHLKWWKNIPIKANVTTSCLSMNERGCNSRTGWITDNDYIYSGRGHADDSYLVLTLKLGGFRGTEQVINTKPVPVATISFYFELECASKCTFFFMQNTETANTAIVDTWEGAQAKQLYTLNIYKTEAVEFNWAFQKRGWDDEDPTDYSHSYDLKNDIAKIYEIVVTNTIDGGADRCRSCPRGADMQGCIPCPPAHYISTNSSKCTACPPDSVVRSDDPWGIEACIPCGSGLVRSKDKQSCVSNCLFKRPDGQEYDFTPIAGVQTTEGARLFTASGTQYYHHFNFSLCANEKHPLAMCKDNISYGIGDEVDEHVSSMICRTTLIPPSSTDDDVMAAQPVSLGDILVNITSDPNDPFQQQIAAQMQEQGLPADGKAKILFYSETCLERPHVRAVALGRWSLFTDMGLDVHFQYLSQQPTSACRQGRSSVITLRCDMAQEGSGTIDLPPKCPDGTCDGCNFHFLWRTQKACPMCKEEDYSVVVGECKEGIQSIHYIPPKSRIYTGSLNQYHTCRCPVDIRRQCISRHCVLLSGNDAYTKTKQCTILPFWLQIGIGVIIGLGLLMCVLVIYCWKKNRKLEYKYSKLVMPNKDDELPAAPTCALDEDDEDEQFDSVQFSENKGKKFFNKLKNIGKKEDNPFETIALNDKNALM